MFGLGKNKEEKEVKAVTEIETEATVATATEGSDVLTLDTNRVETDPYPDLTAKATATTDTSMAEIDGDMSDEPAPLTRKEAKALKKSKYASKTANNDKYTKMYIIRNKKTNQVVELRAASSFHACNIIGWKPRKVQVLDVRTIEIENEPQTVGSSMDGDITAVIEPKSE